MRTFTDGQGTEWSIAVTVSSLERCRDAGHDLLSILDSKSDLLVRLHTCPYTLHAVLWSIVRPEAESRGITDTQFGDRLCNGDVLESALTALLDELTSFFRPGPRAVIRAAIAKMRRAEAAAMDQGTKEINALPEWPPPTAGV